MKTKYPHTKVTVKLRKSETENLWYLYLEAYPVYESGKESPTRKREYLNRSVNTPKWDKNKTARTTDEKKSFKPLRDLHGVIQCKSEVDKASCEYAEEMRKIRQSEYDKLSLYTDKEKEILELKDKQEEDFIEYFERITTENHRNGSKSIIVNWNRVHELLLIFSDNKKITFSMIDKTFIDQFRKFILNAPCGGGKSGTLSKNSASTYFSIFLASLKQAFIDGYFTTDIAAKSKRIQGEESRREHLTQEEIERLASTECKDPVLRRAAFFSILTGLRHCDIQKLKWSDIQISNGKPVLNFTQKKTKGVEYMPINEQAYQLCGEPQEPNKLVFEGLTDPSWISKPLERWIKAAGITRRITFHCFRHTYATLQLANGTDLFTVSKMLGHTNVKTTQIYAKVVNKSKDKAADNIHIKNL